MTSKRWTGRGIRGRALRRRTGDIHTKQQLTGDDDVDDGVKGRDDDDDDAMVVEGRKERLGRREALTCPKDQIS